MFEMGVGVLLLMGLGFAVVALPVAIVWVAYRGLSLVFWALAGVLGFAGRGVGTVATGVGKGVGATYNGVGKGIGGALGLIVGTVQHLWRFLRGMVGDALHLAGNLLTGLFFLPLVLFNFFVLRWRQARHYAGAIEDEFASAFLSGYRLVVGHPARLLGLTALTEGFERRIPDVIARAPGATAAAPGAVQKGDTKSFEGYQVLGSLKSGGSGGRLYLARPNDEKKAWLQQSGCEDPDRVVIKSFALDDGSTLPQIVRESRALEAAKNLRYVLEHELTPRRFHYVMPYVDGDELTIIARRMHDASGPEGLNDKHIGHALAYSTQLLETLEGFHAAGLWHKDIKPSNILVADGRVHVVDLGLVTPLASAMTLTTHGTEYFRDPEMVRLAMKGVKVHEVDGVKFDLYSTGAVLYSMFENSFPAHGSLSNISKRCPDAFAWIVRRSMADIESRYSSSGEMLRDLRVVYAADDPFRVRPADLPSFQGLPFVPEPQRPDPFQAPRQFAAAASEPKPVSYRAEVAQEPPTTGTVRKKRRGGRAVALAMTLIAAWVSAGIFFGIANEAERSPRPKIVAVIEQSSQGPALVPQKPPSPSAILASLEAGSRRGGSVLIVNELPETEFDRTTFEGLFEALEQYELEILGLSSYGLGEERADEADLMAAATFAISPSTGPDDEALDRLQSCVIETTGLDAVLWLSQGEDGALTAAYVDRDASIVTDERELALLGHVEKAPDGNFRLTH